MDATVEEFEPYHTPGIHGTDARYKDGCRCEECTKAHTEYQRSRR